MKSSINVTGKKMEELNLNQLEAERVQSAKIVEEVVLHPFYQEAKPVNILKLTKTTNGLLFRNSILFFISKNKNKPPTK